MIRVHRVVVASGARARCREAIGGSGSLAINPNAQGKAHADIKSPHYRPFSVGVVDTAKGYVHVVDGETLEVLLTELDTVADFIAYLVTKEALVASDKMPFVDSEESFLAWYLREVLSTSSRAVDVPSLESDDLRPDGWESLRRDPIFQKNREQDAASRRIWDVLIEMFTASFLGGTALADADVTPSSFEKGLRVMAEEPRLHRVALTHAFSERLRQAADVNRLWRYVLIPARPDVAYLFYFHNREPSETHEEYTKVRRAFMTAHCMVYTNNNPSVRRVVVLGTEAGKDVPSRTWELMLAEQRKPFSGNNSELDELQQMLSMRDADMNSKIIALTRDIPG